MNAYFQLAEQLSLPRRWIVVAETPFLPANGGDEREHLGFVQAAMAADLLRRLSTGGCRPGRGRARG